MIPKEKIEKARERWDDIIVDSAIAFINEENTVIMGAESLCKNYLLNGDE